MTLSQHFHRMENILFLPLKEINKEICLTTCVEKILRNLSNNNGNDWNPRFDSKQKNSFQWRDGNWEIYSMNLNGSNQLNITNHSSTDYSFIILPNIDQ